ncbi:Uncharacterised protein [BD1-7 clade bacterium]|uniref:tRNA-uridine aminocarboxypropyltransferase n=1 Tax=BD1-7 clade bacterium TaxID=2029982 RepID=A0A5S9QGG2_9GAMM|nr:Uncharacterised protein [BD1-7 clade bacterium]CAA0117058.1 Uncharacterised protein [BD1-7 clade bacterium]
MYFYLLTHSREVNKPTNTGRVAHDTLPDWVSIIKWQRNEPSDVVLSAINTTQIAVLYPAPDAITVTSKDNLTGYDNVIVIDGTWQEARKIHNKSPYLHPLPHIQLAPTTPSRFNLRRNQIENGLCTAECISELLAISQNRHEAEKLDLALDHFIATAPRNRPS